MLKFRKQLLHKAFDIRLRLAAMAEKMVPDSCCCYYTFLPMYFRDRTNASTKQPSRNEEWASNDEIGKGRSRITRSFTKHSYDWVAYSY